MKRYYQLTQAHISYVIYVRFQYESDMQLGRKPYLLITINTRNRLSNNTK